MIGTPTIFIAILATVALAIDQTCSNSNPCPSNAECE